MLLKSDNNIDVTYEKSDSKEDSQAYKAVALRQGYETHQKEI